MEKEKQIVINAIGTLAGTVDALNRAQKMEAIDAVVKKILELVEKL